MHMHSMQENLLQQHILLRHGKLADVSNTDLVRSWRGFLERYHSTTCALERALNDEHQLGMSEFEVLDRLAEWETAAARDGEGKRVQDLAASLHLSQSALSRVVARLERDGLVTRGMCSNDRRGIYVHLTELGRSKHARALPTQRMVLAAEFASAAAPPPASLRPTQARSTPARPSARTKAKVKATLKAKVRAR